MLQIAGPWRTVEDVELATLSWVHWWNTRRLLEPIGNIPPVESEAQWRQANTSATLRSPESDERRRGGTITADETSLDDHVAEAITT